MWNDERGGADSTRATVRVKLGAMQLPLSVLDLAPVGAGVSPSEAIRASVELAKTADQLGYTRFWVAEHHNIENITLSAPEIMIAHIASVTKRIHVGAGGIMIPNHTPLRVIEIFRTLEALHPGRIDLGLGRAAGTDPIAAAALRRSDDPEVNQLLAELLAFERGEFPDKHPFRSILAMPSDVRLTSIWMLGSTFGGAEIAAQLGLPYAFAGHLMMRGARESILHYRRSFRPSAALAKPYAILVVNTLCAADDEEARRLMVPARVVMARNRTGRRGPILSVDEALAYPITPQESAIADEVLFGAAIGGPARVAERLREAARETEAQELMVSTLLPDLAVRQASLERVRAAMS